MIRLELAAYYALLIVSLAWWAGGVVWIAAH